jgi:NADPH:quinone reductase-like Zn-dependent oxidoreductase
MSKAVQFDSYGGIDVLEVRNVPRPVPGAGQVLVEVKAARWPSVPVGLRPGMFVGGGLENHLVLR